MRLLAAPITSMTPLFVALLLPIYCGAHRVLLADAIFPNEFGKWRLVDVLSFIERYDTDIIVPSRVDAFAGTTFHFSWTPQLRTSHHLDWYDLLIFDPTYNAANQFNEPGFDGTAFNHQFPASYMLRRKKFRHEETISLRHYDCIYSIFSMVADYFLPGRRFQEHTRNAGEEPYPTRKQVVRLYPGGGFNLNQLKNGPQGTQPGGPAWPTDLHVVAGQAFIAEYMARWAPKNPRLDLFGNPVMFRDEILAPKEKRHTLPLLVVFTSLGEVNNKGADLYVTLAEAFRTRFPRDDVVFRAIGNVPASWAIEAHALMPQSDLDQFYRKEADVIIALERSGIQAWPLASEAMAQGVVLFTTDVSNQNEGNGYRFGDHVNIVELTESREHLADPISVLERLRQYASDRALLHRHSKRTQEDIRRIFGYERQNEVLFRYIEKCVFPAEPTCMSPAAPPPIPSARTTIEFVEPRPGQTVRSLASWMLVLRAGENTTDGEFLVCHSVAWIRTCSGATDGQLDLSAWAGQALTLSAWLEDVRTGRRFAGTAVSFRVAPRDDDDSHFDFVEIGTSNFNTLIERANTRMRGLSVEPMVQYLTELPVCPKCIKENSAISSERGILPLYFVPPRVIHEHGLPLWVGGCNSLGTPHAGLREWLGATRYDELAQVENVAVLTFSDLAAKHGVRAIEYLKVDVEGHDVFVLESMLRHCDRNPSCFPRTIQFESLFKLDAATRAREEAVIDEFVRRGYTLTRRTKKAPGHEDVILNKYS